MKADLQALGEWLQTAKCTHVAMESTGVYWKPIFHVLEGRMEVLVVNAQHLKAVPGRKTDMRDAEWIADLLQHGLLRPSFIPSAFEREIRELTRYRTRLIQTRSRSINRLHKTLEDTNIKLTSVATDIMGQSAQAILKALLDGQTDPQVLAELAKGKMRAKRELLAQALAGKLEAHHRFLIQEHLSLIEYLDERIEQADSEIAERLKPYEESITRLDTIPGSTAVQQKCFWLRSGRIFIASRVPRTSLLGQESAPETTRVRENTLAGRYARGTLGYAVLLLRQPMLLLEAKTRTFPRSTIASSVVEASPRR